MSKKENELKEGFGFLHQTKEKSKEKSPDFFGSFKYKKIEYRLSGWKSEDDKFIQITLDEKDKSEEENKELREEFVKDFKKSIKKNDKGNFVICELSGNLHLQKDKSKNEDFFGTFKIDGKNVTIHGFIGKKGDNTYLRLEAKESLSNDERKKLSKSFI